MRFVRPLTFGHTAAQERVIVRQHRLELLRWGQRRAAHPGALLDPPYLYMQAWGG